MPRIKKRIYASALLLVTVLVFNIWGYYYINRKSKQTIQSEDAITLLMSNQTLAQQVSQAIIVLNIHQSFSPEKYHEQINELNQLLAKFKVDFSALYTAIEKIKNSAGKDIQQMDDESSQATKHFNDLSAAAENVLKDKDRTLQNDYSFAGQVRSNEAAIQKALIGVSQTIRSIERKLEDKISIANRAIILSLFIALFFIVALLIIPTVKLNIKSHHQLQQSLHEVQRSEAMLRTIIDSSPDFIFILDKEQKYKMVNKTLAEALNLEPENFCGKNALELGLAEEMVLGDTAKRIWQDNEEVFASGRTKYIPEEILQLNGKTRIVSLVKTPLKNNEGKIWGLLGFAHDITDLAALQEQLMEEKIGHEKEIARATIDAQEKERHEIGKELHDNINQILTCAKLYIESMPAGDGQKHRNSSLDLIQSAIQEIRKLSKLFVPPPLAEVGLISSINDLLENIYTTCSIRSHLCHNQFEEGVIDNGLKMTICRIIQEQTTNILKYADATEIKIELSLKKNLLHLKITDNGKGFDTTIHRRGVGITNMKNRAEIYQGKLEIFSSPGKGCTVTVAFKLMSLAEMVIMK